MHGAVRLAEKLSELQPGAALHGLLLGAFLVAGAVLLAGMLSRLWEK